MVLPHQDDDEPKRPALFGEAHPRAALTALAVEEIRRLYDRGGVSYRKLARRFGVSKSTIHRVVQMLGWVSDITRWP